MGRRDGAAVHHGARDRVSSRRAMPDGAKGKPPGKRMPWCPHVPQASLVGKRTRVAREVPCAEKSSV